ncbi:enoyl-CoA hydratase [Chromobacterium amazonense]|uniref:Enoyl-CoA hydratase n=1 Tax=Chromobacterium amazonense TaxID=1382803 RepID=A0A2S9X495_9NEIS|nr:enoyl-CoA hydratase [Chromobacterium amazonense]PRP70513.1 enoyl-CoA hydratase [Chromobacterium amazonense]
MARYLTLERLGKSAIVTLSNLPANLLTTDGLNELASTLQALNADDGVRSVVITGAGDTFFSAGADLKQFASGNKAEADVLLQAFANALQAIRNYRGVTVAAVNGFALGGGLECALVCDYIIAERGAKLGLPEAKVGLIPAAGGTKTLADKVGLSWAKRIILGGEQVSAEQALQIGLIEEVVDQGFAKIVAVSLANKVASQAPSSVAAARKLIEDSPNLTLDEHLKRERAATLSLIGGGEQVEGVAAFLAKRAPSWMQDDDD